jgi:hypothetical protein
VFVVVLVPPIHTLVPNEFTDDVVEVVLYITGDESTFTDTTLLYVAAPILGETLKFEV